MNYKFEFTKEELEVEGEIEYRYLETRSRWYLSRSACLYRLGVDPEDFLKKEKSSK